MKTARLALRPFVESDLEFVDELHRDPLVSRYLGEGRPRTRTENEVWLERTLAATRVGCGQCVVVRRDTGEAIGRCGLTPYYRAPTEPSEVSADPGDLGTDALAFLELGYTLARRAWGMGFATEAAAAVLREAPRGAPILSLIHVDNTSSMGVAHRLGFVPRHDARWRNQPMRLFGPAEHVATAR